MPNQFEYDPPQDLLDAWFRAWKSYATQVVEGTKYFVRPVARGEARTIIAMAKGNEAVENELLCRAGCLWPEDVDWDEPYLLAGVVDTIARRIRRISGIGEYEQEIFDGWRSTIYDKEYRQDLLITRVFPAVKLDELDEMSPEDYYRYLALADWWSRCELGPEAVDALLSERDELIAYIEEKDKQQQTAQARGQQQQAQQGPYGRRPH